MALSLILGTRQRVDWWRSSWLYCKQSGACPSSSRAAGIRPAASSQETVVSTVSGGRISTLFANSDVKPSSLHSNCVWDYLYRGHRGALPDIGSSVDRQLVKIAIKSPKHGYICQLWHQNGPYLASLATPKRAWVFTGIKPPKSEKSTTDTTWAQEKVRI